MKANTIIVTITLNLLLPCLVWAQSSFGLANKTPPLVDAPVFDPHGQLLSGPNYMAELWGSSTPGSLTPLVDVLRGNSRVFANFVSPGYFFSGNSYLSVDSVPPFGYAWLQVRVWDSRLGPTYEQVLALGIGGYGESPLFYAQGGDPFDQFPMPGDLIGLQSFSLREVVPEPSSMALLLIGLAVLFGKAKQMQRLR